MLDLESVSAGESRRQRSRTVAVRAADGSVVARDVTVADRFGSRLMGLMGRDQVGPDEGLWLLPCNSVHMFFMRTPLDIAYLDRQQRVVRCVPEMREWRVKLLPVPHAHSASNWPPARLAGMASKRVISLRWMRSPQPESRPSPRRPALGPPPPSVQTLGSSQ